MRPRIRRPASCLASAAALILLTAIFDGKHILSSKVAAALEYDLVLKLEAISASALERYHGVVHIQHVAKAGVGINDQRQTNCVRYARCGVCYLGQTQEALIRQAEPHVGDASAGDIEGLEAQIFDDPSRQRINSA